MFYLPVELADPEMGQPLLHKSNSSYIRSTDGTHAPSTITTRADMTERLVKE